MPVPEEPALDNPVNNPVEFFDQRRVTLESDADTIGRKAFLWREREREISNFIEERVLKNYSKGSAFSWLIFIFMIYLLFKGTGTVIDGISDFGIPIEYSIRSHHMYNNLDSIETNFAFIWKSDVNVTICKYSIISIVFQHLPQ